MKRNTIRSVLAIAALAAILAASCASKPAPAPLVPVLFFVVETEVGPVTVLDDRDIDKAYLADGGGGVWQMTFSFTVEGTARLKAATEENIDRKMSIIFDGKTLLSARIMAPITDGRMLLVGLSEEEANQLDLELKRARGR